MMTCGLGSVSVVDSLLTVAPDVGSVFVLWFAMHCFVSFSRFTLILMLASATSMWERVLDLKVYVFLLTIPWRCLFCGSFL